MRFFLSLLAATAVAVFGAAVPCAEAHIFIVTGTNDLVDLTTTESGKFASLRSAIIAANQVGGANIILLQPETYLLSVPGPGEANSYTGDLDITSGELTIIPIFGTATIDASGLQNHIALSDRAIHVWPRARVNFVNLVITGGSRTFGESESGGGGIFNEGSLCLRYCKITGNSTVFVGGGGGIFNSGFLELDNCEVSGNASDANGGGGILNSGFLVLNDCKVTGNTGDASGGAGIFNVGKLIVERSVISKNITSSWFGANGGGIYNAGELTLNFSAITSNQAGPAGGPISPLAPPGGSGGGIYNIASARATLNACVISGNRAGDGGITFGMNIFTGSAGGDGGGIYSAGILSLNDCAVSDNVSGQGGFAGGFGGNGGGIYNGGKASLDACTVIRNSAGSGEQGLYGFGGPSSLGGTGGDGGGIFTAGAFDFRNCVITLNFAGAGGAGNPVGSAGGDGGNGGGIYTSVTNSTVNLWNTLVVSNAVGLGGPGGVSGTNGSYPNIAGSVVVH